MKELKYILILLIVIGVSGGLIYYLSRKRKNNIAEDRELKEGSLPSSGPMTNVNITAEGKTFSTLYGVSEVLDSLNPLLQSIPGLIDSIRGDYREQDSSRVVDPMETYKLSICSIHPTNPVCK